MKTLTVAGCRIPVGMSISHNVVAIMRAIDWAHDNHADIMVTPECALTGYMWAPQNRQDARIEQLALALTQLQEYSLLKGVDLVLGTACYNAEGEWGNMQAFIVDGDCVDHYEKQVLFGAERYVYAAGDRLTVLNYKEFKIAGLICNDLWSNPILWPGESALLLRELMRRQVDVVFVSANIPPSDEQHALFYTWTDTCIRMYSLTGHWNTVISDQTIEPGSAVGAVGPVGVVGRNSEWLVKGHDLDTNYFKFTVS
jgi:predicted amidohydrolase